MFKNYIEKDHSFDKLTMLGIICLIITISGVFGFCYEVVFYYFNSGMTEIYWRGGNFLPWINIYAIGAVCIYFLTYKKRKNPLFIFIVSLIASGILEYIGGWILEEIQGVKCWDYNTEILSFGNINGYVCLRSVLSFAIFSLVLMYIVVPICFNIARKTNKKTFLILTISICGIILFDEIYNLIIARIFKIPRSTEIYRSLGFKYKYF